ncbi:SDR family oxidoreductase [Myxococcota bacterium]|jgi:citronellol/citronellal dehydrogenase|nr:SDR family oxidoreductase [Myxococcota bacterium]
MRASAIYRSDLLRDKVVVITGGGSGIGQAIALECARLGARVAIGGRSPEKLAATRALVEADGGAVFTHAVDIRDTESIDAFAAAVTAGVGPVDVLVNNAGGQFMSHAIDIRPKGWKAVVDTNLNGTWFVTQAFGRQMIARRSGRVINIVANMWRGFPGMAHTGAARAAVVNLTQTLALEWAKHGILVNAVAPGIIESSGLDNYGPEMKAMVQAEMPKHVPLKRLGTVDDVAFAVVYLASPAGDFVTGETVCVDGGQKLWGMAFPP